ncbi:hypothetical protein ACN38_g2074 [Penicillium nordicum]|uniref:Uncharacterized protein n=1 Tax=Penicillium nordicum TaxID=229535 RepID=A0A0M8P7L8_9EURO|nr:hypothetical protein ACN38_g2074 [Penicillium nordicum]
MVTIYLITCFPLLACWILYYKNPWSTAALSLSLSLSLFFFFLIFAFLSGLPPLCLAGKNEGRARDRTRIAGHHTEYDIIPSGTIAQLGERAIEVRKVAGSIPARPITFLLFSPTLPTYTCGKRNE